MAQEKKAIDVGDEIAEILLKWRPDIVGEDVASAIMYALEHYSETIEEGSEVGMGSCLFKLQAMVENRIMSL